MSTKHQIKKHSDNEQLKKNSGSRVPFTQQRLHGTMTMNMKWTNDQAAEEFHHEELFTGGNQSWTNLNLFFTKFSEKRYKNSFCYLSSIRFDGTWICSLTDDGIDAPVRSKNKIPICVIYIDLVFWWWKLIYTRVT